MSWLRAGVVAAVLVGLAVILVSGGSGDDSSHHRYLPETNELRTVHRHGGARTVEFTRWGDPDLVRPAPGWLLAAKPLEVGAPGWARRMYRRSLLVMRALTDRRSGAVIAGAREGWAYVWPRDAGAVALAFAASGYRGEARRIGRFLLGLDLGAAARFHPDGSPVAGRAAQGDAAGWVAVAARAGGLRAEVAHRPWRDLSDYQEGEGGDYLGSAIAAAAAGPKGTPAGDLSARRPAAREIGADFETDQGTLVREAGNMGSGADSTAAWAVRPFPQPALFPAARRTLLRIAAHSGRFGVVPSEDWDGGVDPWTAPTAWTAWSLAALGERRAALHLMATLRQASTQADLLPERVDAQTGVPTSTTPLAWSHAFAVLALHQLWP